MSKDHPECPLYTDKACKEAYLPKVCAIVREDKKCLREHPKKKESKDVEASRPVSDV